MPDSVIRAIDHDLPAELELWWLDLDAAHLVRRNGPDGEDAGELDSVRRRSVVRSTLLDLLSHRLGRSVEESEIVRDPGGKPRLRGGSPAFNLAHSGGEALIGIGTGVDIGVDLEVVRAVPEADAFAEEYLSASERETWRRLPAGSRHRWLLGCWTRKEACLKALGVGLSVPPAEIPAGAGPDTRRVAVAEDGGRKWLVVASPELPSGSPGAAAIVLPKTGRMPVE
ncbi:MAG: 4'-phosphopantetheinyl transferase superfamily protein [Gemmatimonadota bacterium]